MHFANPSKQHHRGHHSHNLKGLCELAYYQGVIDFCSASITTTTNLPRISKYSSSATTESQATGMYNNPLPISPLFAKAGEIKLRQQRSAHLSSKIPCSDVLLQEMAVGIWFIRKNLDRIYPNISESTHAHQHQ